MDKLTDYFPSNHFTIIKETDKDVVKMLLESKASSDWVQGDVGDTGWFQLSRFTYNTKNVVVICKKELTVFK